MSDKPINTRISAEADEAGKAILDLIGGTWSDLITALLEDAENAGEVFLAWKKRRMKNG